MKKLFRLPLLSSLFLSLLVAPLVQSAAITITPANFLPSTSAQYLPGINRAGGTILAGQPVYVDTALAVSSGQIKVASATGTGLATQVVGLAAHGASAGQPIKVVTRDPDLTLGGTVSAGLIIIMGVNGALHPSADNVSTWYTAVIAVGKSSTKVNFGGTKYSGNPIGLMRSDAATP